MSIYVILVYLLISIVFIEGLSYLITNSQVFYPWRVILSRLGNRIGLIDKQGINYLEYMVNCHLCTSHQIAIFVAFYQPYLNFFPTNTPLLNIIIFAVLMGRTAYIVFNIYELLGVLLNTKINIELDISD